MVSNPGSEIIRVQIINPSITITTTTTLQHVSATTIGGNSLSIHPLPNQRGTTPHHDRNPATADQYYAPPVAREVVRPQVFSGKMKEVSVFVNMARLYIRIKMTEEVVATQVAWVLSYMQRGIAEAWKNKAHNPEIDWEKGEVKMTCCPSICGKRKQEVKEKKVRKMEKDEDKEVLKKLVPRRFWKWKKVFGKKESERMPVQKIWDHAIELKEGFTPRKGKVYSLLREEREEVQTFVEDQLRKGYI